MRRALFVLACVLALPACRRSYVVETTTTSGPSVVSGGGGYTSGGGGGSSGGGEVVATGSFQLLYLPTGSLPLHLLARVHVETTDGRVFELGPADLAQVAAGRVAVRIPAGVTTGTATIYLNDGRTFVTTFHIAVSGSGAASLGTLAPGADPRCSAPSGTWVGTISDTPGSTSTVWLEVLGDCRTVRGFVHLETSSGSVDSTIEGTWDPGSGVLVARDTQLFNIVIRPGGGGFCATDEYRLQLTPDGGTIYGQNIIYESSCAGTSQVYLQRSR